MLPNLHLQLSIDIICQGSLKAERLLRLHKLLFSFGFWIHEHPTVSRKERIISLDCKTDFCAAELGPNVGDNETTEREGRQWERERKKREKQHLSNKNISTQNELIIPSSKVPEEEKRKYVKKYNFKKVFQMKLML